MSISLGPGEQPSPSELDEFRMLVLSQGARLYRDLAWRNTRDPYAVWISEVMLQQTQVARVDGRWQRWLQRFPSYEALAAADSADVLAEWQGMGYNRRALSLWKAAQAIASRGSFPVEQTDLVALPGVGPATAAGIRAFAYDLPGVYLETNVRTVFLHELFAERVDVSDRELIPLVAAACPKRADHAKDYSSEEVGCPGGPRNNDFHGDPRTWYYALLDYGAYLKRTLPNPSRRSRSHTVQSRFEGSHRQKRAEVLRIVLQARTGDGAGAAGATGSLSTSEVADALNQREVAAGRPPVSLRDVEALLSELKKEGFILNKAGYWGA